jgi:ribosomal protein S24E
VEVRVLEQKQNPLLKRVEIQFEVDHSGASTPRRGEVVGELAKQLKVPKERLVVEAMHARFGLAQSRGEALVYANVEARDRVTREHILIRNGLKEKKVAATPGAEAPAAEAAPAVPKVEAAKPEAPAPEAKPEAKAEPKAEKKAEHKGEPKAEHKGEPKAEHKGEPKAEHKGEPKAEHKGEPKAEKKAEPKSDSKPAKAPKKEG